ncbi:MAG: phosphoglycerate dehydrogenase [Planctomycetaceae bacterium]|jgi:D-3-phosphoglycerate dehydrogenase|nr:phosphoglycerate dehydrogenase [Planctomycetaceae bacterium]
MPKIVLLDPLSEDGKNMLRNAPGIEFDERIGLKGDELKKCLTEFDGAIVRSGVKITAESLEGNTRLKMIARAGAGFDNIDTKAATKQGIIVVNTPGGNTVSTAEQTFALLLALSRNTAPAYQALIEGRWDRKIYTGNQLAAKTIGIVGMGRIGQVVAGYAKAFDMKVLALDPFFTPQRAEELGITLVNHLHEMLPQIDFLTVHTPLNDQTRGMFGKKELELVKKGAKLINCARGGIYDLPTLVEGMETGKLGGVALDVYEEEPCTNHPLFGKPNVVCTPHLGASTEEAQSNVALEAVELLIDYFMNGTIRQAVNFGTLDAKTLDSHRGHLNLAYRLGMLSAQMQLGSIKSCKLRYKGAAAKKDTKLVSSAFAAGLTTASMNEEISIVSAVPLLKERGIDLVEEQTSEVGEFWTLIAADLEGEHGTISITGTLYGNAMPRLVSINDYKLEGYLDGNLLFVDHQNKPGVIGGIGFALGKRNLNISSMSVGHTKGLDNAQKQSIGVLTLDDEPDAQTLKEIEALPLVMRVNYVKLPPAETLPGWMG